MARVFVHLNHGRGANSSRISADGPTLDYGYHRASSHFELLTSCDRIDGAVARIVRKVQRRVLGFDLWHAWTNRNVIASADVIWTHTEYEWQAIALLQTLRILPPTAIVAQSVWLWDRIRDSTIRGWLSRRLLNVPSIHVTHSRVNHAVAKSWVQKPCRIVPYGIDPLQFAEASAPSERLRIVVVGNDRDRDWELVVRLARHRPDFDIRIISRRVLLRDLPPNLVVYPARDSAQVRDHYVWSSVALVPVRHNGHASGLTASLEAITAGRPLVATDVGGLRDYLDGLAEFHDPGSLESIEEALEKSRRVRDLRHRRDVLIQTRKLTEKEYVSAYCSITDSILLNQDFARFDQHLSL